MRDPPMFVSQKKKKKKKKKKKASWPGPIPAVLTYEVYSPPLARTRNKMLGMLTHLVVGGKSSASDANMGGSHMAGMSSGFCGGNEGAVDRGDQWRTGDPDPARTIPVS